MTQVPISLKLVAAILFSNFHIDNAHSQWVNVGTAGFSAGSASYQSLAIDTSGISDTLYVAYRDAANGNKTTVMKFNGTNWVTVGAAGFSSGDADFQSLAIAPSGTPYIACRIVSSSSTEVNKFDGTNWVTVGTSPIYGPFTYDASLTIDGLGTPYVAMKELMNPGITVMKFDGANWVIIGAADFGSTSIPSYNSLAIDTSGVSDTLYVAYRDAANGNKTTVMKFNGTNWVTVGAAGFSSGDADFQSLAIAPSGTPYIACRIVSSSSTEVKKFDGTNWVTVGASPIYGPFTYDASLTIDGLGTPYVAMKELMNGGITVMKFDGTNWVIIGAADVGSTSNPSYNSLKIGTSGILYVAYLDAANGNETTVIKYCSPPDVPTIAASATTICSGENTTLSITGGNLNDATSWQWYSASCGGTTAGSGTSVTVSPTANTTYYVRGEGCATPGVCTSIVITNATPSAPTSGNNSPICEGQTLSLTANTIAGATYSWNGPNGFSSSSQNPAIVSVTTAESGTYSVTATVSGCTGPAGTTSVTINQTPSAPTASSNSPVCSGQTLSLTASVISGAVYSWTGPNGFSSSSQNPAIVSVTTAESGTYSVTATVSGCTGPAGTTSVTINQTPSAPTASNNSPVCSGQTLSLTASAISGAVYSWTGPNGFSSSSQNPAIASATTAESGTYSVTATVSGCTGPAGTTSVTINQTPSAPTASSNSPVCSGQTLSLTASAISGAVYSWTGPNGFSSSSQNPAIASVTTAGSGIYSVTAIVSGCTSPAGTISVTVNPLPATPIINVNLTTLASSSSTGNQWHLNGTPIAGAISQFYNVTQNGFYTVCVTDANGCSSCSAPYNFTTIGIEDNHNTNNMIVYPNPTNGKFTIKNEGVAIEKYEVKIYNVLGEKVYSLTNPLIHQSTVIDISSQPNGVYFINISALADPRQMDESVLWRTSSGGKTERESLTQKIIIQK